MATDLGVDTAWHPLADGCPPEWASEWGQDRYGVFISFSLGNLTQRLRWIPPGQFMMGSPETETQGLAKESNEVEWFEREHPQHRVFITRGFWLFDTACTQALWEEVMGYNPSRFQSPQRPVDQVSWGAAQEFLAQINQRVPGLELLLPTEAQWEHACRAGNDSALYTGPIKFFGARNAPALDPIAWYGGNSGVGYELEVGEDSSKWTEMQYPNQKSGTHPVGRKKPNPWGLHDMLGNVWEWCADGMRTYSKQEAVDPVGSVATGAIRVIRGGSWSNGARGCRCAYRGRFQTKIHNSNLGFRCARVQGS